ncbi:SDR family NAD(P)-dependent oxidoreductase [Stappia sp.]|uniref:SDR family NAD(P)-dependent oxidoreductase n=1 Tax=Stappia sp. TaxID=1870903 RepID=UPI003A99490D
MTSLQDVFGLSGRVALVTGSSRGIGAAIARGLAGAGATVIVHGQSEASTVETRAAIERDGGRALALSGDLGARGAGSRLVDAAEDLAGHLDILVVNASAQVNADLAHLTEEDLDLQLSVNLRSTVEMLQACLPRMATRGWGRVVNIGSINQLRPKAIVTAYAATKAAQHNIVQSQARDYARHGVLLNTLAPGLVDTDRNAGRKQADPDGWEAYVRDLNWMGRAGDPSEMVGAAIFLASNACSFMTGETVVLSGGY